ncbi:MAG TPA: hypothetical protein VEY87_12505 [Gaiellaceae bacterium]|nr:hypothetical protein [Gaiellaceae bacterium]
MAVRRLGGPGPRRAARGRTGLLLLLAAALYLAAGAASTWPALRDAETSFLAGVEHARGAVPAGDHLQASYQLWLPGHQLARGEPPWRDPYSFQPLAEPRTTFAGWPFALVYGPLHALFGTVGAWNLLVLLSYVGSGLATFAWLRALEVPRAAALAGGLAFALAPYRVAQLAAGHQLALVALLLPLALYALERRRTLLAAVALASIPLSGQVHLALGAIPFVALYAALRPPGDSPRLGARRAAAVALPAVAAGLLVWAVAIRGSLGAGGRSFAQVERYSVDLGDLASRRVGADLETFVLLGWLTPLLALAGFALVTRREPRLAVVLGLAAVVPVLLALGANLPGYETLWNALPGLRETRVPSRFLPLAALALAGLAAFALARAPRAAAVAAVALVAVDLRADVQLFRPAAADAGNPVYDARPAKEPLLELPVYLPDRHEGSVYQYYAIGAPGPRFGGYSTVAPRAVDGRLRALKPLECGAAVPEPPTWVLVHRGLYTGRPHCLRRLLEGLSGLGYAEVERDRGLVLYRLKR